MTFRHKLTIKEQLELRLPGNTIIPLIISSDETQFTTHSGDKKGHPVYVGIGNIDSRVRKDVNSLTTMLFALLPVPPKHTTTGKARMEQQEVTNLIRVKVFNRLFSPLNDIQETGIVLPCGDGYYRRCYPKVACYIADYMEHISLNGLVLKWCPVCEAKPDTFEDNNQFTNFRRWEAYKEIVDNISVNDVTPAQFNQYSENLRSYGVKMRRAPTWGLKCFDLTHMIVPDLLHTLYLGVFKHLMRLIVAYLHDHKRIAVFNQLWKALDGYPRQAAFKKDYEAISQWTGKELKRASSVILAIFSATVLRNETCGRIPSDGATAVQCVQAFTGFMLMAQYRNHTSETIGYTLDYMERFQEKREVFRVYRAYKETVKAAKIAKKTRIEELQVYHFAWDCCCLMLV